MVETRAQAAAHRVPTMSQEKQPRDTTQQPQILPSQAPQKQSIDDPQIDTSKKRRQLEETPKAAEDCNEPIDPIEFWVREQQWPSNLMIEQALARKKPLLASKKRRSNCGTSITTSSCQTAQQQKSASYHDQRYVTLLSTKDVYMEESDLGITDKSKQLCQDLLNNKQQFPEGTIFNDDAFGRACKNIQAANEARVVQDISRLLVPSAETLGLYHDGLRILKEGVDQGWDNAIPLTTTRPQPDYCVGFRRRAFTADQLEKLSPFIGDFLGGDISLFMATFDIYFPFLTCEVKSGSGILNIADRQNAHSMALAVRGVVELLRLVNRMNEVNRQILAFSFSHNNQVVQIYGHYPVVDGDNVEYYRHTIRIFDFSELDGKERWTAYQFTRNLYELWMPEHFKMICEAIDQIPLTAHS